MKRSIPMVLFTCFILFCIGCATQPTHHRPEVFGYEIADRLESNLRYPITAHDPLIFANFVNVNRLKESSTFGRILSEQLSSRFTQKGFKVIEVKLRQKSVFMEEGKGEFLLSRDLREVSSVYNASAVVVGTYGEGLGKLYVSARIVRPSDNVVISAADVCFPVAPRAMNVLLSDK